MTIPKANPNHNRERPVGDPFTINHRDLVGRPARPHTRSTCWAAYALDGLGRIRARRGLGRMAGPHTRSTGWAAYALDRGSAAYALDRGSAATRIRARPRLSAAYSTRSNAARRSAAYALSTAARPHTRSIAARSHTRSTGSAAYAGCGWP